jgi:hypothetical protein
VLKVKSGVYNGLSFGASGCRVVTDKAAQGGRIIDGEIYEVSLVDRPANPECMFTMTKSADGELVEAEDDATDGDTPAVDVPAVEDVPPVVEPAEPVEDDVTVDEPVVDEKSVQPNDGLILKFVSAAQRRTDARSGAAMPDGSFPIEDAGHLTSAIGRLGNFNGDKAAAKAHIIKRARALGLVSKLPEEWGVSKAVGVINELSPLLQLLPVTKADDGGDGFDDGHPEVTSPQDIANARMAIAYIAKCLISEAEGLAGGDTDETSDIAYLLEAVCALKYFIECESDEVEYASKASGSMVTDSVEVQRLEKAHGLLTEENISLKAELERMAATPLPGGPTRSRAVPVVNVRKSKLEHDHAEMLRKATMLGGSIGDDYRVLAKSISDELLTLGDL